MNSESKSEQSKVSLNFLFVPLAKTITFILFVMISGILCSSLVGEITPGVNTLNYSLIPHTKAFIGIIIYLVIILTYQVISYKKEKGFEEKIKKEYEARFESNMLEAIIEKKCAGSIADKYNELIKDSKSLDDLDKIINNIKGGN